MRKIYLILILAFLSGCGYPTKHEDEGLYLASIARDKLKSTSDCKNDKKCNKSTVFITYYSDGIGLDLYEQNDIDVCLNIIREVINASEQKKMKMRIKIIFHREHYRETVSLYKSFVKSDKPFIEFEVMK